LSRSAHSHFALSSTAPCCLSLRGISAGDFQEALIGKNQLDVRGQKCLEFRLDFCLGDQPARARPQDFGERIIPFLSKGNNSVLVHGVTLLQGDSGGRSVSDEQFKLAEAAKQSIAAVGYYLVGSVDDDLPALI
jgi:hypothetical protein